MKDSRPTQTGGREATTGHIAGDYAIAVGISGEESPPNRRWRLLTDLARLETGHTPSRRRPEYWDGDVPWIGIRDATGNHGRTLVDTDQHITQAGIDNSSARLLPTNTVCLSRTASVGHVVVMGRPMATSQDFVNWVCDPEKLDYRYLKYALLAERGSFSRFSHGTTHQTIYFPEVKAFHLLAPEREEQSAIADVLSALDDKIEQNHRTARALERLARMIFRAWFVDFEPVKAKAAGETAFHSMPEPAFEALSARFVDSRVGRVPEGWEVKALDEVAEFLNGLALQKYPPRGDGSDLPVIKIAQLRKGSTEGADAANDSIDEKYEVQDGDLLFSWSGTLEVVRWFGGPGALNQHLFKVTSADYPHWLIYEWVHQHLPEFRQIAASRATTMGHIKRSHLRQALVAVPPIEFLALCDELLSPIFEAFATTQLESRKLAEIRDYLLPKLLVGEARVEAAHG